MTMKNFKKLKIWQNAILISDQVFDIYEELPWQKAGILRDQSTRASVSIVSNVAEGSSRRTEREKYRYMEMALGSAFELEAQTIVLHRRSWAPKAQAEQLLQDVDELQKMIIGFMARLNP